MFLCWTPWKRQKTTKRFLTFSGGVQTRIARKLSKESFNIHWKCHKMGSILGIALRLLWSFIFLFQGIEFLSRLDHCRCYAVHAAIVLNHEHVLLKPEQIHAPLCKICFSSFLRKYYLNTQPFLTRLGLMQKLIKYLRLSALPKFSMASSHKVFC